MRTILLSLFLAGILVHTIACSEYDGRWVTVSDFESQNVEPFEWRITYVLQNRARFSDTEVQLLADATYNPVRDNVAFPEGQIVGGWLRLSLVSGEDKRPFGEVLLLKKEDWLDDSVGDFIVAFDADGNLLHPSEQISGSVKVKFTVHRFQKDR